MKTEKSDLQLIKENLFVEMFEDKAPKTTKNFIGIDRKRLL